MSAHSRSLPRFLQPTASRLHQEEATIQHRKALSVRANSRPPAMHFGSSSSLTRSCTPPPPTPPTTTTTQPTSFCESTVQPLVRQEANVEPTQEHMVEETLTNSTTLHKEYVQINENEEIRKVPTSSEEEVFVKNTNLLSEQTMEMHESNENHHKRARSPAFTNSSEELETQQREEEEEEEEEEQNKEEQTLQKNNRNKNAILELKEMLHTTSTKVEVHPLQEEETERCNSSHLHHYELTVNKDRVLEEKSDGKEILETRFDLPRTLRFSRPPPLPCLSDQKNSNNNNNQDVNSHGTINDDSNSNKKDNKMHTSHVYERKVQHSEEEEEELLEEMLPYSINDIVTPKQNKTRVDKQEFSSTNSNSTRVRSNRWANEFPLPRITWTAEQVEKVRVSLTSSSMLPRAKSTSGGLSPLGSFPTPPNIHEWPSRRSIVLESESDKENNVKTTDIIYSNKENATSSADIKCNNSNIIVDHVAADINETNDVKETSHEASPMPTPERFAQSFEVTSDRRCCQRPSPMSSTGSIKRNEVESSCNNNSSIDDEDKCIITLPSEEEEVIKQEPLDTMLNNARVQNEEADTKNDNVVDLPSTNDNYVNEIICVPWEFTVQDGSDTGVCEEEVKVSTIDSNTVTPIINNDVSERDESNVQLENVNEIITCTSELSPIPTTSDLIHSVEASAEKRTCECARPEPIDSLPSSSLEHSSNHARTLSPLPVPAEEHHVRFMRVADSFENSSVDDHSALIIHPTVGTNPIHTHNLFESSEMPQRDHRPSPLSHSSSSKPTDAAFTSPQPEHSYSPSPWPTTEQIISSLHALRALHDEHRVAELHSVDDLQYAQEDQQEQQHYHEQHEEEERESAHREETELCVEETEEPELEELHQESNVEIPNTITELITKKEVDTTSSNYNKTTSNEPNKTENGKNSNSWHEHESTITVTGKDEEESCLRKSISTTRTPSPTPSQHHYEVSLYASSEKRRRNKQVMEFEQQEENKTRQELEEEEEFEKEMEMEKSVKVKDDSSKEMNEKSEACRFARELSNAKSKSLSWKREDEYDSDNNDKNNESCIIDGTVVVYNSNANVEEQTELSTKENDDLVTMECTLNTNNEQDINKIIADSQLQAKKEEQPEKEQNDLQTQCLQNLCKKENNDNCSSENTLQEKHTVGQVASPAFSEAFAESAMFVDCMSVPPTPQLAHLPPEYYEMEAQIRALSHSRGRHSLPPEQNDKSINLAQVEETECSSIVVVVAASGADAANVVNNTNITTTSLNSTAIATTNMSNNNNNESAPTASHEEEQELEKQTLQEICKIDAWAFTGPSLLLQEIQDDTTEATASSATIKPALEPARTSSEEKTHSTGTQNNEETHTNQTDALECNVQQEWLEIEEYEEKEQEQEQESKKSAIIVNDVYPESSTHINGPYFSSSSSLLLASIQTPHIPFTSNVHVPLPLPKSQHTDHRGANNRDYASAETKSVNLSAVNNMESPLPRPVSLRSQLNFSPYYVITPHGITNASAPLTNTLVSQHRTLTPPPLSSALGFYSKTKYGNYNNYNYNENSSSKPSLAYELSVSPLPSQHANQTWRDEMPTRRRTPSFVLDPPTPVEKVYTSNIECVEQEEQEEAKDHLENKRSNALCTDNRHDRSNYANEFKLEKNDSAEEVEEQFDNNDNNEITFSRSFALSPVANTNVTESYGRSSVLLPSNYNQTSEFCSSNLFDHVLEKSENKTKVGESKHNSEMLCEKVHSNTSTEGAENKFKRKREEFDELEQFVKNNHSTLHVNNNTNHTTEEMKERGALSGICEKSNNSNNNNTIHNEYYESDANMECKHETEVPSNKPAFPSALYAHRQREQLRTNMARYNTLPFMSNANTYGVNSKTLPMSSLPVSSSSEEEKLLDRQQKMRNTTTCSTTMQSFTPIARVSTQKEHDSFREGKQSIHLADNKPEIKESERYSVNSQDTPMPHCAIRFSHKLGAYEINDDNTNSGISNSTNSNKNNNTDSNFTSASNTNKKKRLRVSTRLSTELRATLFKQTSPNVKQKEETHHHKEEEEKWKEQEEVKQVRRSTRRSTKTNDKRRSTQHLSRKSKKEPAPSSKRTNAKTPSASLPLSALTTSTRQRASKHSNEIRIINKRNSAKAKFVEENSSAHNVTKLTNQSKAGIDESKKNTIKKRQIGRRQTRNKEKQ